MEIPVENIFQKGLEAQKADQLDDAVHYYSPVLKSDQNHSDANNNMSFIALGLCNHTDALNFFEQALISNPTFEISWIGFIETIIELDQIADSEK